MDIVVANGFAMERCTFFSREYHCCVLHNTRCKCEDYNPQNSKPLTNYDRLIRKTPEELAKEIVKCRDADIFRETVIGTHMNTEEEWLDWLKQEADT